jgi:hypothetical protein
MNIRLRQILALVGNLDNAPGEHTPRDRMVRPKEHPRRKRSECEADPLPTVTWHKCRLCRGGHDLRLCRALAESDPA